MACNEHDVFFGAGLTSGITPGEIFRYTVPQGMTVDLRISIIARAVSNGVSALFEKRVCVKNNNGVIFLVGNVIDVITAQKDAGAATWTISGAIEGEDLVLNATGSLGLDVQWLPCSKVVEFANG